MPIKIFVNYHKRYNVPQLSEVDGKPFITIESVDSYFTYCGSFYDFIKSKCNEFPHPVDLIKRNIYWRCPPSYGATKKMNELYLRGPVNPTVLEKNDYPVNGAKIAHLLKEKFGCDCKFTSLGWLDDRQEDYGIFITDVVLSTQ